MLFHFLKSCCLFILFVKSMTEFNIFDKTFLFSWSTKTIRISSWKRWRWKALLKCLCGQRRKIKAAFYLFICEATFLTARDYFLPHTHTGNYSNIQLEVTVWKSMCISFMDIKGISITRGFGIVCMIIFPPVRCARALLGNFQMWDCSRFRLCTSPWEIFLWHIFEKMSWCRVICLESNIWLQARTSLCVKCKSFYLFSMRQC